MDELVIKYDKLLQKYLNSPETHAELIDLLFATNSFLSKEYKKLVSNFNYFEIYLFVLDFELFSLRKYKKLKNCKKSNKCNKLNKCKN